jgi:iron complex transport system permease protein
MKYSTLSIIYIILAIIVLLLGIAIGNSEIFFTYPANEADQLIVNLRLTRMLGAFVTGAALACSGLIFQAILKNPLAEPFTLGLSGGSAVGAALSFITGVALISTSFTNIFAFIGAIAVLMLVLFISKNANSSSESLLLSGVITGTIMSGILMYLISIFPNADKLAGITWWMLGNLQTPDYFILISNWILLIVSGILIQYYASDIDAMSIGSLEAYNLGVNPKLNVIESAQLPLNSFLGSGSLVHSASSTAYEKP